MKYRCIVHLDYAIFSAMSADEIATLGRGKLAYDAELAERRQLIGAHGLEGPDNALIVKVRDKRRLDDGRLAELG